MHIHTLNTWECTCYVSMCVLCFHFVKETVHQPDLEALWPPLYPSLTYRVTGANWPFPLFWFLPQDRHLCQSTKKAADVMISAPSLFSFSLSLVSLVCLNGFLQSPMFSSVSLTHCSCYIKQIHAENLRAPVRCDRSSCNC